MNMIEAVRSFYANYVNFSGRSQRSTYWWWFLFYAIVSIIIAVVEGGGSGGGSTTAGNLSFSYNYNGGPIAIVWSLINLIPGLALGVRRLHDLDKSGWWLLIALVPLIGAIVLIVWFCTRGTVGPNRFGPDPLADSPIS